MNIEKTHHLLKTIQGGSMKRPSPKSIRKAFAEHLTVGVDGYEQTVWDILHWVGIDDVLLFLQDYAHVGESVGVHVDYEHMSTHNLEESIKQEAQACVGNEAEEAQRIDDASWRP